MNSKWVKSVGETERRSWTEFRQINLKSVMGLTFTLLCLSFNCNHSQWLYTQMSDSLSFYDTYSSIFNLIIFLTLLTRLCFHSYHNNWVQIQVKSTKEKLVIVVAEGIIECSHPFWMMERKRKCGVTQNPVFALCAHIWSPFMHWYNSFHIVHLFAATWVIGSCYTNKSAGPVLWLIFSCCRCIISV